MLVIAHRGGSPEHPDNSAGAFREGIASGADILECDLQMSADGDIVVFHDTEIFGVPVKSFTTDELRGFAPSLLTFEELLELLDSIEPATRLVLDLKSRAIDRSIASYLKDDGLRRRVLVTSTFSMGLRRLKQRFPDLRTGLSRGATISRLPTALRPLAGATVGRFIVLLALPLMKAFGIRTAALRHDLVDRLTVRACHRLGIRVDAWTVDSVSRAEELRAIGVDYLTTNASARMVSLASSGSDYPGGSTP